MTIGDRIRSLRIEKGMTQEELGEKVGVKKAAINKYENGIVVNLKQSVIANLAEALETTPTYLLGYEDEEKSIPARGDGMEIYKILTEIMEERGLSIADVARICNLPDSTVRGIIKRKQCSTALEVAFKLAEGLGVSLERLNGLPERPTKKAPSISDEAKQVATRYEKLDSRGQGAVLAILSYEESKAEVVEPVNGPTEPEKPETRTIPLYRTPAAAGYLSPTEGQDFDDYEIPYDLPGDFAVRIDGDSMEPYIHDGEIVRCVRSNGLQIGEVGIFYVDGDTLCKQFCTDGQNLYLLSLNRDRADADRTIWHFANSTVQLYGKVLTRKKPPMP